MPAPQRRQLYPFTVRVDRAKTTERFRVSAFIELRLAALGRRRSMLAISIA